LGTTKAHPARKPEAAGLPFVSVIVPTYNRAALLPHLLHAIAGQIYPSSRLEMIVVDNSSTDGTSELVKRWAEVTAFPVRYVEKTNDGPTSSRNLGASMAQGDILAYTDSDCIPDACWIRNAARHLQAHPEVSVVCGPMLALRTERGGMFGSQHEQTTRDTGLYPSGNLVLRTRCFREVGGYDERFGIYPWGALVRGEDTDLVWRARRRGHRAEFRDDVLVWHLPGPPPRLWRFLLQPVVMQIFPRLLRTVPELRESFLWRRYFVARDHALFYLAAAGVIATVRTGRLRHLGWTGPWLYEIRGLLGEELRRGGPVAAVKALLLLAQHLAACGLVLVYASLRYRRLVL